MNIQVALEWFLNPDHLPLIAGIEKGWFAEAGMRVELIAPDDHYDGLAAVIRGEVAFACNEPLHMIDEARPGLKALGCFFETDGGILLTAAGAERLRSGETVRVASPVAGGVTDDIAVEILRRWLAAQDGTLGADQVQIESAGFAHLDNLHKGFDAAWLCFANFEGVEARHARLDAEFITTGQVGLANFSALELFTGQTLLTEEPELVEQFVGVLSRGAAFCRDLPDQAAEIYYGHSDEERSALLDAIIAETCPRLVSPVVRDAERWRALWRQFDRLGHARVDADGFEALYRD